MFAKPVVPSSVTTMLVTGTAFIAYKVRDEGVIYVISAALPPSEPPLCECGVRFRGNGSRSVAVMDLPAHERSVKIEITLPRYVCPSCGKSHDVRPADLHPTRQMTQRLFDEIQRQGLERSFAEISRMYGVGEATVAEICRFYIDVLDEKYEPEFPLVLTADEVHMGKGKDFLVLTDHNSGRVIEILPDTKKQTLIDALRRLKHPSRCLIVVMDMCHRYRDAVRAVLPHVIIVVDRWHVTETARRCLVTAVGEQYRHLPSADRMPLLALRGLMVRRQWALTPDERQKLETVFEAVPYLRAVYDAKEALFDLYKAPSFAAAMAHLDQWLASLSRPMGYAFKPVVTALGNWRDEVLAYWQTSSPVTNGPAEGMNSVIKRINREGGGGLSFKLLRARVIYGLAQRRQRAALVAAARRTRRKAKLV